MDDDFLDDLLNDDKNFAHLHNNSDSEKKNKKKSKGEKIFNAFDDDGFNDLVSSKNDDEDSDDIGGYNPTSISQRPPSRALSVQE